MKIFWKTIGIASAAACAASIITSAICKCSNKFYKTFKDDSEEEKSSKKESK